MVELRRRYATPSTAARLFDETETPATRVGAAGVRRVALVGGDSITA